MKVVFDTNIFISAFVIPGGKAEEAFLKHLLSLKQFQSIPIVKLSKVVEMLKRDR